MKRDTNRHRMRWFTPATVCAALAFATLSLASSGAEAQGSCEGYAKRIQRLGGKTAFQSQPANTLAELQQVVASDENSVRFVFEQQGLGHVADAFIAAVETGNVSERDLVRGEVFKWMSWRRNGQPRTSNDLCVDTNRSYSAWVVPVTVESSDTRTTYNITVPKICVNIALSSIEVEQIERDPAVCRIKAKQDCETMMISVDATGSSPGAEVTMMSSDGASETIIPSGSALTWSGKRANPYTSDLTFKVMASNEDGETCEDKVEVSRCIAPAPSCSISVDPSEAKTGDDVTVDVKGYWAGDQLALNLTKDGNAVTDPVIAAPFPTTVNFSKPGTYMLAGTATNEVGETASCEASFDVDGRWKARAFAGPKSYNDDTFSREMLRADGVNERLKFGLGSGLLIGAGLERYLTERVGIEGAFHLGDCDATLLVDFDEDWGMQEESLGLLALTIGPNFHLSPKSKVDFFIGPFIGLAELDDTTFNVLGQSFDVDLGSEFIWGGQLGLDIPFGESAWGAHVRAMYMDLSTEATGFDNFDLDLDPTIFAVGLGYEF